MFDYFNVDNDATISLEELRHAINTLVSLRSQGIHLSASLGVHGPRLEAYSSDLYISCPCSVVTSSEAIGMHLPRATPAVFSASYFLTGCVMITGAEHVGR